MKKILIIIIMLVVALSATTLSLFSEEENKESQVVLFQDGMEARMGSNSDEIVSKHEAARQSFMFFCGYPVNEIVGSKKTSDILDKANK